MEHSNLHSQHQLQDQVVNAPTSSLPALLPSTSTTANKYSNSSNIILNSTSTGNDVRNDHQLIISEAIPNSNSRAWYSPHDHQDYFMSYRNDDITRSCFTQLQYNYSPNQQLLLPFSNIKEEISSDFFSKLMSEKLSNPLEVADRLNHHLSPNSCKQDINIIPPCDMVDNIWLNNNNSISSAGFQKYFSAGEAAYSNATTAGPTFGGFEGVAEFNLRYDLSDTFPLVSTNYKGVSDPLSSSLGFNFQGLDLLSSSTQSSSHVNNLGLYEPSGSLGHDHHHDVQGSKDTPSSNTSNITSAFKSELVSRTKRPSSSRSGNFSEPKASQSASKKSRPVLRSSNPPLKIRKEKLGDRIAALHRLVAPFGKTDTASVLTEAIGYIQFLQDQVQTMSVPYMKSLQSKPTRKMQQQGLSKEEEKETTKRELRSRGLCLVPTSCVSYISGYDD